MRWLTKLPWTFARTRWEGSECADGAEIRSVIALARSLQPEILETLSSSVRRKLGELGARGVADVAWSMAKLRHRDEGPEGA